MPSTTDYEVEECDQIKVNTVSPDPVEEKLHIDQTSELSSKLSFSRMRFGRIYDHKSVISSGESATQMGGKDNDWSSLYRGDLSSGEEEADGEGEMMLRRTRLTYVLEYWRSVPRQRTRFQN